MIANAQKQNPVSYYGGLIGTGIVENALMQGALSGTKYGQFISKLAGANGAKTNLGKKLVASMAQDIPVDLALDIVPQAVADALDKDMSTGDVVKSTLGNIGLNALFNAGGAVIGNLDDIKQAVRKTPTNLFNGYSNIPELEKYDFFNELIDRPDAVKQLNRLGNVANNVVDPVELAAKNADIDNVIKQQEQAVENVENISKQMPEMTKEEVDQVIEELEQKARQEQKQIFNKNEIPEVEEPDLYSNHIFEDISDMQIDEIPRVEEQIFEDAVRQSDDVIQKIYIAIFSF